jgi:hypothetical protein
MSSSSSSLDAGWFDSKAGSKFGDVLASVVGPLAPFDARLRPSTPDAPAVDSDQRSLVTRRRVLVLGRAVVVEDRAAIVENRAAVVEDRAAVVENRAAVVAN